MMSIVLEAKDSTGNYVRVDVDLEGGRFRFATGYIDGPYYGQEPRWSSGQTWQAITPSDALVLGTVFKACGVVSGEIAAARALAQAVAKRSEP